MKVSILSDEISVDPVAACEIAASWGMKYLEFRLWMQSRGPVGMSDSDMSRTRKAADDYGISFPSISPGLFKLKMDDPAYVEHCGPFRERCYDLAETLGAGIVVLFPPLCESYDYWYDWPARVTDDMAEAAEAAGKRGLMLALENEPACYAGSGQSLAKLVSEINHPNLRANWDPGNHTHATGEDFRAGYEALKPWHIHTHVKDYTPSQSMAVPPGEGGVDWAGQLAALNADGYDGLLVLETHFVPKIAGSKSCYENLCRMLADIGEGAQ
ncbi:MAG: sugar phosphate isomerase/epimerase family protein [Armatimonadota bacterium]